MEKEIEKLKERIYILQKPVEFEGKSYQELDFSKIDSLIVLLLSIVEAGVKLPGFKPAAIPPITTRQFFLVYPPVVGS